jgi:hypothetical protein
MIVMDAPVEFQQQHSQNSNQFFSIQNLKDLIRKELTCQKDSSDASIFRMEVTSSISNGHFTDASARIMASGLEQMREKNEQLYLKVLQLQASNKRMKDQLKLLVSVEGEVAKRAKEALDMEGA